jgi:hypothetical protein
MGHQRRFDRQPATSGLLNNGHCQTGPVGPVCASPKETSALERVFLS